MGTRNSNTTISQTDSPKSNSQGIFCRMTQRVLLSKEELCIKHHNTETHRINDLGIEMSLYYDFLKDISRDRKLSRGNTRNKKLNTINSEYNYTGNKKHLKAKYVKRKELSSERSIDAPQNIDEQSRIYLCNTTPKLTPFINKFAKKSRLVKGPLPRFDRVSLLPSNVFMIILSYFIDNFKDIVAVNPSWYNASNSAFNSYFNRVENLFIEVYGNYLLFKDSNTCSSPMRFCDITTMKIDRVFKCENLPTTTNKTLMISFKYKYFDNTGNIYKCEYIFDSVNRQSTITWLQLNATEVRTNTNLDVNIQPIPTICTGDNIEFAIPFYSLRGLIDAGSIQWLPPRLAQTPKENIMNYKRDRKLVNVSDKTTKLIADLGRVSEFEDSQVLWRCVEDCYTELKKLKLVDIKQYFDIISLEYSHVDIYVAKITLKAHTQGKMKEEVLGIPVIIRKESESCTREVKRVGLSIERQIDLQLRIRDTLIIYILK